MLIIMGAFWEKHWLVGKSRKGSRYYKYILTVNYFILGLKIRKYARYYSRVLREKLTFGGKSRKCARYYKRVLRVNYLIFGLKIRKHARYYSHVLREKLTFGGKNRKCARYYKRVLREKLTFGTLISRSTLIICQNFNFWHKKSKTCPIL